MTPVAVAHQGQAEPAPAAHVALAPQREQLALDPVGALEPPGGERQAPGEQALQHALGRQRIGQRLKPFRVLTVERDEALRAQAVLQRVAG